MIVHKIISQVFKTTLLRFSFTLTRKPTNITSFKHKQVQSYRPKKEEALKVYDDKSEIELAESIKQLPLKQFSIKIHHLLVDKQKSPIFWSTVEQQFLERMTLTTNPVTIRSYSKVIYSLSKAKKATANYQTKISMILPFATPQSFTTMVSSASRIAPFSQQFGYIVEKLYFKRKDQFNARQIVTINYSLANNGRKCDVQLIDWMQFLNAREVVMMLRCYDLSDSISKVILQKTLVRLKRLQQQFNALDISDIIFIYLKHDFINQELQSIINHSYNLLKRHINDICIEKIWIYVPKSLNSGKLKVSFVEDLITTIKILRKGKNMSQVIWKKIQPTFKEIDNIELKVKLQKIY